MPLKAALLYDPTRPGAAVFGRGRRARIAALANLYPEVVTAESLERHLPALDDLEVIFASWGIPRLADQQLARLPRLKAVFYAAGSVRGFAGPLLARDIVVVSAQAANAVPVAEMCLAQILLSLRGYFRALRQYAGQRTMAANDFARPGVHGETIGLIGMGKVAMHLRELLRAYPLEVIAHDPYLSAGRAAGLGVKPVTLDQVFERAFVVSNHMPDLPATRGALNGALFGAMRAGATFINTGRGAQVVEDELAEVLEARPDLTALLDVTWPEPPSSDSRLWQLSNVLISPHVAGSAGDELARLADTVIEQFEAWRAGRPLRHQVTQAALEAMGYSRPPSP